jgi:hypothetical protein
LAAWIEPAAEGLSILALAVLTVLGLVGVVSERPGAALAGLTARPR